MSSPMGPPASPAAGVSPKRSASPRAEFSSPVLGATMLGNSLVSASRVKHSTYEGLSPKGTSSGARFGGSDADALDVRSRSRISQTRNASRQLERVIGFQPTSLGRRGAEAESLSDVASERWREHQKDSERKRAETAATASPFVTAEASYEREDFVQPVLDQVYDAVARMDASNISLSEILQTVLRRTVGELVHANQAEAQRERKARESAEWMVHSTKRDLEAVIERTDKERAEANATQASLEEQLRLMAAELEASKEREAALAMSLSQISAAAAAESKGLQGQIQELNKARQAEVQRLLSQNQALQSTQSQMQQTNQAVRAHNMSLMADKDGLRKHMHPLPHLDFQREISQKLFAFSEAMMTEKDNLQAELKTASVAEQQALQADIQALQGEIEKAETDIEASPSAAPLVEPAAAVAQSEVSTVAFKIDMSGAGADIEAQMVSAKAAIAQVITQAAPTPQLDFQGYFSENACNCSLSGALRMSYR